MLVFPYGRKNIDMIVCFFMRQFLKVSFRGKYKEFRTRIWTPKSPKTIGKIQYCKIHRKTSSFRSLNNLVEKYKVHRSIQLVEMGFAPFFRIKNNMILRKLRPKTVWVQKSCLLPWYFSSHFSIVFSDSAKPPASSCRFFRPCRIRSRNNLRG